MIVAIHTTGANLAPSAKSHKDHGTFFATILLNSSASSNTATIALNHWDENLEWNVWPSVSSIPSRVSAPSWTNRVD